MCLHLFSPIRRSKDRFRLSCWFARSLKEPWRKVLKVAAPRLPLVVGSGGFVEDVLNVCFEQRGVQPLKACAHSLRLGCPHSDPQQMHFLCERGRICKHAIVVGFGIQLPVSKHEHAACSAESSDVGKEIQMIKCDLESLHSAHGKTGHGAMIAIRQCAKVGIDVDRKSTRLNSSHRCISYAVFCLKKKKNKTKAHE